MLIQFIVSNYASIKNEVILSMAPSADKEHPENIIKKGGHEASSLVAIYGANASGKSNLFKAMTSAILAIRFSNAIQIDQNLPVVPYKFCADCEKNPSKFEFTFIAEDNKKYIYGFSATQNKVVEEYLYCYKTAKPSLIFERDEKGNYKFSRAEKTNLQPLVRMNTANKLFLATATAWNTECTTIPYKWFAEKIDTQTNIDQLQAQAIEAYQKDKDANIEFVKNLMLQADINISDVSVETKEINPSELNQIAGIMINGIPINDQRLIPQKGIRTEIKTGHKIQSETGEENRYSLDLSEESQGTIQLFFFAPILRDALEKGKTLMIDEIDRSLHPYIVKYLVNIFRNPKKNTNGAQLIFTTHETTLLSLDTFRRDQIFFTEKDAASGVTDLYSLDDFSVRKDENIEKGYLIGRYGAVPFLQTEEIV